MIALIDKAVLKEILEIALINGGDFSDIYIEHKKTTGISCEGGKIEKVHSGLDAGAGIRVLAGDSTAYAYTNDLSREGLANAALVASRAVQGGKKDYNIDLRKLEPVVKFNFGTRPDQVKTEDKVKAVEVADKSAREVSFQQIKQVMVAYGDVIQNITIANSDGDFVEDERIRTRLAVQVVAAQDGTVQTGYDAAGSMAGFDLLIRNKPEDIAKSAAVRAVRMLEAIPAPSGRMPVVMAGEAGGTMVHEACGHGLEADLVQKELSVYSGKKGQEVAADYITVIDDATIGDRYGSYSFDDEAVASQKVVLIKNGILEEFLYDRLTATKDGIKSNGHGRRESYQHKPIPRMANTYISPGKDDPCHLIKEAGKGILVTKMGGGQVNTTTGDFVFDVAEGFLIENGEQGSMIRGATLTGNGPEVLRNIKMVGSDLGFTIGTCGKDGQGVPVSDAQPTLWIEDIIVGGTVHSKGNGKIKRV